MLFVGVGTVDAYVDFTELDESAIRISEDGTSVVVNVPAPQLSDPTIDPALSHVADIDEGLLDRLGDLLSGGGDSQQELYVAASAKMRDAAAAAGLQAQAEENTTKLLEGLLTGLGFESVTINYSTIAPVPSYRG